MCCPTLGYLAGRLSEQGKKDAPDDDSFQIHRDLARDFDLPVVDYVRSSGDFCCVEPGETHALEVVELHYDCEIKEAKEGRDNERQHVPIHYGRYKRAVTDG